MTKETLYEIYDSMFDVELITNNLYYLERLNINSGRIFLSFVKNGLIDDETIEAFINLSQDIDSCDMDKETEEELVNIINQTLMNDYVSSDDDFSMFVDNYSILIENETIDAFLFDTEEEVNYYKIFIVKEFSRILSALDNKDLEALYIHDMCNIMDSYKEMLEDLKNTTSSNNKDYNEILKTRIKYFVDLASDKDIFALDEEKYSAAIWIASKVSTVEKLKTLKGIIKFNKNLGYDEFINTIDSYTQEFNKTTISNIFNKIGIKKIADEEGNVVYIRKTENSERERKIAKKVLKPKNNA